MLTCVGRCNVFDIAADTDAIVAFYLGGAETNLAWNLIFRTSVGLRFGSG